MSKSLAVFDFDQTIIDNNADTAIMDLIGKKTIPKEVWNLHKQDGWTTFMQGVFNLLYQKNINQKTITEFIGKLQPVPGMTELIRELNANNYDVIIISDCNSYFINTWLQKQELDTKVHKVFTNPSEFVNGMLIIEMYHLQETCKASSKNLCKGQILEEFIAEQKTNGVNYNRVVYCGDGNNDFCPILRLGPEDLACARNKYKCMDLITAAQKGQSFDPLGKAHVIKAEVLIWDNGEDILKRVRQWF